MVQDTLSVVVFRIFLRRAVPSLEISEQVEGVGSGTEAAGAEGLRLFSISSLMRDSIEVGAAWRTWCRWWWERRGCRLGGGDRICSRE